jgi:hypothetical protein
MDPNNTKHVHHQAEDGDGTQFDLSNRFGEFRHSCQDQDGIWVAQMVNNDQCRVVAGIIFQPGYLRPGTDKDDNPAQELEKAPEETPAEG